jgi:hypothetical protein
MTYFVVLPGALVPASIASRLLARANAPALARRLARARVDPLQPVADETPPNLLWLWHAFGGAGERPVTAPYAWRALNRASATDIASDAPLWQVDPVHFALARDHMLVARLEGDAAIDAEESRELAEAAAGIARDFGATLRVLNALHWFVSFEPAWDIEAVSLDAAVGRSVQHVLPTGEAAARWRKLLTEVQMHWHQHRVNEARDAAGRVAINGLWLHGGGTWLPLPKRPFDRVIAEDAAVRGWALASGVAPSGVSGAATDAPDGSSTVLVYDTLLRTASSHEDWDAWLDAMARLDARLEDLSSRAFAAGHATLILVLAGRQHLRKVTLRRVDRWAIWRRHSMADLLAEPDSA